MKASHQSLYDEYKDQSFLDKTENYALWTISSAFPENYTEEQKRNQDIEHDYQSIGALLVNSVSSKLTGLLFPANQAYFRMNFSKDMQKVMQKQRGFNESDAKAALVDIEREACSRIFLNAAYAQLQQLILYLVITGNALLKREDAKLTVYSLRNYALLRDNSGTVLDIVLRECVAYGSLPKEIQDVMVQRGRQNKKDFDDVTVYTRIKREYTNAKKTKSKWVVTQQVDGMAVGAPSTYPEKLCPYIPVGWKLVNGDSYCRGLVEDYAGDFAKLSDLSRALALYQIDACKVVNMVKPGSGADIDELARAETGDWVYGDPDTVKKHEGGEYQKLKALAEEVQSIFQRLSVAFMYQGNIRDAERVTAEEIRMNAEEADKVLGGVYSQLSAALHMPLAYLLSAEVDKDLIAAFANGELELEVLTGLTALGRGAQINALVRAANILNAIVPALKGVSQRFDTERIVDAVLQSEGLNPKDWMLSEKDLAREQAANQAGAAQLDPLAQQQTLQGVM